MRKTQRHRRMREKRRAMRAFYQRFFQYTVDHWFENSPLAKELESLLIYGVTTNRNDEDVGVIEHP